MVRSFIFIFLTATMQLMFMNCNNVKLTSAGPSGPPNAQAPSNASGGGGIDGMQAKFSTFDSCGGGPIQTSDTLYFSNDLKSGVLTRQNCTNLSTPQSVKIDEVEFLRGDSTRLVYHGKVYDAQTQPNEQVVTLALCRSNDSAPVTNLVWTQLGRSDAVLGSVSDALGATTGMLQTNATAGGYASSAGQASQFQLNLTPGQLSYAFANKLVQTTRVDCIKQGLPEVATLAPLTRKHYAPNSNLNAAGVFDPALAGLGFNLGDISDPSQLAAFSTGTQALVYLNRCSGADSAFQTAVLGFTKNKTAQLSAAVASGNTLTLAATDGFDVGMVLTSTDRDASLADQTVITAITPTTLVLSQPIVGAFALGDSVVGVSASRVFGFYLIDGPKPSACPPSALSAESDWIHHHLGKQTASFITLDSQRGTFANGYSFCETSPCSPTNHYGADNTTIDYFGVLAYACRSELNSGLGGCDYGIVKRNLDAAKVSGVPLNKIIPVYQSFGGPADDAGGVYQTPKTAELATLVETWGAYLSAVPFDYFYSWGVQNGDIAISTSANLQQAVGASNTQSGR